MWTLGRLPRYIALAGRLVVLLRHFGTKGVPVSFGHDGGDNIPSPSRHPEPQPRFGGAFSLEILRVAARTLGPGADRPSRQRQLVASQRFLRNIRVTARAAGTAIMRREFPRHDGCRVRATPSSCARRYCAHARRLC